MIRLSTRKFWVIFAYAIAFIVVGNIFDITARSDNLAASDRRVLAINWQPAFCETQQDVVECQTQTETRFDASNFTLHGLWSESQYCGVTRQIIDLDKARPPRWLDLPAIDLSEKLWAKLQVQMPGVASGLHLHEWYKHGTCYSQTPEEYFRESLALLEQINNSSVRELFVKNIGKEIVTETIRTEFDRAFSNNAGDKVSFNCKYNPTSMNRSVIVELKLYLQGKIEADTSIANLLKNSKSVALGCSIGEIDPVGFE